MRESFLEGLLRKSVS